MAEASNAPSDDPRDLKRARTTSTGPIQGGGSEDEQPSDEDEEEQEDAKRKQGKGGTPVEKGKRACARCRQIKVKCVEASDDECVRCRRLDLECVWLEPQKRGRKVKATRRRSRLAENTEATEPPPPQPAPEPYSDRLAALIAATASPQLELPLPPPPLAPLPPIYPPPTLSATHSSSPYPRLNVAPPLYPATSQPFHPSPQNLLPSPLASTSRAPGPIAYSTPGSLLDTESPRLSLPSLSMMELATAKETALHNLSATGSAVRPARRESAVVVALREPDLIDMHVLNELEAKQLFDHFHDKMNAFIILLDPELHTVDYTRKTSTVLFTSVLAVSSKILRPDLYPLLLSSAKQLVGRGIIDGKVSVGLIQSILLQVYYKEPEDSSAWLRIGLAIRIGYQLHLHAQRTIALPDDDLEARQILDRERTWIVLCAFDHTYFLQSGDEDDGFHQTCMIPHYRLHIEEWLEECKQRGLLCVEDLQQGANLEWIKVQRLSKDIARSPPSAARSLGQHLQGMLNSSHQRYLSAESPNSLQIGTRSWNKVNFFLAAATLALTRAMLIAVGTDGATLARWVQASDAFVEAFEVIVREGYLPYWQDTLGVTCFSMGEFCVKVFPKVYPQNQTSIIEWLERIYRACENASDGRADSTAAFIARIFRLCLRSVCAPSSSTAEGAANAAVGLGVAAMPPPPPQSGSTSTTLAPSYAAFSPSVELSAPPGSQQPSMSSFELGNTDASYWESLFPGQVADWSWLEQPFEDLIRV